MTDRSWHASYEEGVPPSIDFEKEPITSFLSASARRYGDQTAVVFENCRISYRDLDDRVCRLASALAQLGVKKDSRVGIQLPNLPQTVIGYYAVLRLGAQVVMTNPLYVAREIEHQWDDAGVEVAIVGDWLYASKLRPIRDKLPVKHFIVTGIADYLRFPLNFLAPLKLKREGLVAKVAEGNGVHRFKRLVKESQPRRDEPPIDLDDLALLQYTGGTTGVSKGAMLSHRNLSCNTQQVATWFTSAERGAEVFLSCLPYFHVFGMTCSMNWPIRIGATMVLMPNPRDIPKMVGNIEKHRVTIYPSLPALFNAIINFPGIESRDISSIKACFSGSAPLPVDVLERFESMTGAIIVEGFGMTETSPVTHCNPVFGTRKPGTIGLPLPNTDARIVDLEEGREDVPMGEPGELILSGPQCMEGYWQLPSETEKTLRDGWIYSGDIATVDEDGYFTIVGRKKDMIVASGYNVYPDEVDDVLFKHPKVLEAATIGVPDEKRGETVKSFLVLKPGQTATAEEIIAFCKEELAAYKVPKQVEFRDELPKSTVQKILRRTLRDQEIAKHEKAS